MSIIDTDITYSTVGIDWACWRWCCGERRWATQLARALRSVAWLCLQSDSTDASDLPVVLGPPLRADMDMHMS